MPPHGASWFVWICGRSMAPSSISWPSVFFSLCRIKSTTRGENPNWTRAPPFLLFVVLLARGGGGVSASLLRSFRSSSPPQSSAPVPSPPFPFPRPRLLHPQPPSPGSRLATRAAAHHGMERLGGAYAWRQEEGKRRIEIVLCGAVFRKERGGATTPHTFSSGGTAAASSSSPLHLLPHPSPLVAGRCCGTNSCPSIPIDS
jgi:hypothetical protein